MAFLVLLSVNATYFYRGVGAIAELNQIVLTLYDRIVMSTTYAQNVRNDVARFSGEVYAALLADSDDTIKVHLTNVADLVTTFHEDLAVVRERKTADTYTSSIDDLELKFNVLQAGARDLVARSQALNSHGSGDVGRRRLDLIREWAIDPGRMGLIEAATDLNDRLVADGYEFRLASASRTETIRFFSIVVSAMILILNVACLAFIFVSILPRLRRLTEICGAIAGGDFRQRVPGDATAEFADLGRAFNFMLEALRQSEARIANQLITTNAMMDSLGQGFLIFDRQGRCRDVCSKACLDLLEVDPAGQEIVKVLKLENLPRAEFFDWLEVLFLDVGTFEDVARLGPKTFAHSAGRSIDLEYRPLRDAQGTLLDIMLVATDRTDQVRAESQAEREQEFSQMIIRLTRNRSEFVHFRQDALLLIEELHRSDFAGALRTLHTIKGGAATFHLKTIRDAFHLEESETLTRGEFSAERVPPLRQIFEANLAEVEAQSGLALRALDATREIPERNLHQFYGRIKDASVRREFYREFILEPIEKFFLAFDDAVKDLAERQYKAVDAIEISGGNLPVDGQRCRRLFATLVHVFRNAVDHGIETSEQRLAAGKTPIAKIRVSFSATEDHLEIRISDDGRGIDIQKLRQGLVKKGFALDHASDDVVLQHVFESGVSTASAVTDVSGRGVGLDAVRTEARALGGDAWITSQLGIGTTTWVRIPHLATEQFGKAA